MNREMLLLAPEPHIESPLIKEIHERPQGRLRPGRIDRHRFRK
mgnify:FL=1